MATILVQHLTNYINSYPITPKVYIPLIHTRLVFNLAQDVDRCQDMGLRGHISTVQLGGELPGTLVRLDYDFPFSDQWVQIVTQEGQRGQVTRPNPLILLARLEGFEPPTYGLEVRCSFQLSYRREVYVSTSGG